MRWARDSQLEQRKKTVLSLNHCARQMKKWQTDFVHHQWWEGNSCWEPNFQSNAYQACQQNCSHPHRDHKPCSCNFRNTHVYKSSNCTPNYPREPVCLDFCRCLGHLCYLALKTRFTLIDRILSNSSWLVGTNLKIWEWHTQSGSIYEFPYVCSTRSLLLTEFWTKRKKINMSV